MYHVHSCNLRSPDFARETWTEKLCNLCSLSRLVWHRCSEEVVYYGSALTMWHQSHTCVHGATLRLHWTVLLRVHFFQIVGVIVISFDCVRDIWTYEGHTYMCGKSYRWAVKLLDSYSPVQWFQRWKEGLCSLLGQYGRNSYALLLEICEKRQHMSFENNHVHFLVQFVQPQSFRWFMHIKRLCEEDLFVISGK